MIKENLKTITKDKLRGAVIILWLSTVVSSFFGSSLLAFSLPAIGEVYPFRVLLPITFLLWFIYIVKSKENFLENRSKIEIACYVLIVVLLIAGAVSLPRAIVFNYSFRRYFNLCYDLCFFFLMLRICSDKTVRKITVQICFVCLCMLCLFGVYEVFFGGIVNTRYDNYKRYTLFRGIFQAPVVFSCNTNDYNASLLFVYGVVLLGWFNPRERVDKYKYVAVTVLGSLIFFLIESGSSRLCFLSFLIMLAGLFICTALRGKKHILSPAIIAVAMLFTLFAQNFVTIQPAIREWIDKEEPTTHFENDVTSDTPRNEPATEKPKNNNSFADEFFVTQENSDKTVIRDDKSGGVRLKMLIHSWNCFKESYGLGVGLGNTEQLAKSREIVSEAKIWSVHCFVARMAADFGIFFLIPFGIIAFLLLKHTVDMLVSAIRKKKASGIGAAILFASVLLMYPIASTSSSDAQDILTMWLFLAATVLFGILPGSNTDSEPSVTGKTPESIPV